MALCSVAASRRAARATCCDPELPFALYRHEPPQPTASAGSSPISIRSRVRRAHNALGMAVDSSVTV